MAKFKTKARTLDLLGRQQIAGIPTAINELFKNAYDAYADNVDVDYFRVNKLFILRDNGIGMTKDDFESRWLTLGTDSKVINSKIASPPIDKSKPFRPITGEKGIGRLAIASVGSQVLILTRAKSINNHNKIVAAFINWEIFELPNINLDDITIPVKEFEILPTIEQIESMKQEVIDSLSLLVNKNEIDREPAEKIIKTIQKFKVDCLTLNKTLIDVNSDENKGFSLSRDNSGTHFYIQPVNENLNDDIDGDKKRNIATKIEKMLLGFTNTMTPNHPKPQIITAFRDYKSDDGTYSNLFDKDNFFIPEDFTFVDHHIQGEFDKYGQFSGKVKIFQENEFDHKIIWNGNSYRETQCGAFSINFAYIQGLLKQSIIDAENHNRIFAKADKYGGLYLYKDNIRILPYGDSDFDWLDIEKNRTKKASVYFFSFRRMFGVIDLKQDINFELKEKAGREGFIENKAYRQLRSILKNFFEQLAVDFFREDGGPKSKVWAEKRAEREAHYEALKKHEKRAKARKDKFQKSLNNFFDDLKNDVFARHVEKIIASLENDLNSLSYISDSEELTNAILNLEISARSQLSEYIEKIRIPIPRGFTISKDTRRDFEAYGLEFALLESGIFKDAFNKIDIYIEDISHDLHVEISKRKRLEQAVDAISTQAYQIATITERETKQALAEVSKNVAHVASELMIGLEDKIKEIKDSFKSLNINNSDDFDLVDKRKELENEILNEKNRATEIFDSITKQLQNVYFQKDNNEQIVTSDQMYDSISEELDELRERVQADIELSQLGLAVGVIHHEFSSTVKSIRSSIQDLKVWAEVNEKLEHVYKNIKINFEHLDGYLTLFTPLNRRLYRNREHIKANDIKIFLIDLFGARFERHNIQLKSTKGFSKSTLYGFRSTFYPVFVNLIDNAIYWLNESNVAEKIIRLHADDQGFYISNNGVEISPKDVEKIFELGFSRKSNGRGMGLHISREVLQSENYELYLLESPREGSSVTFKIMKKD